jgi:hypothetical protein
MHIQDKHDIHDNNVSMFYDVAFTDSSGRFPSVNIVYNHVYKTVYGISRPGFLIVLLLLYITKFESSTHRSRDTITCQKVCMWTRV